MANPRPRLMSMATSGYIYRPHDHHENEDVSIDMQYAKRDCRNPIEFAKEPWEHCRDATNTYLSLRFEKREHFKTKLNPKQRKRVDHEISRIEQTRVNFSSNEKKKQLMLDLKRARKAWKTEVKQNREDFVKEVKEKQPPDPAKWRRNQKLDLNLLEKVKYWNVEEESDNSTLPPKEDLDYGFKACAIYFKKDLNRSTAGWKGHTHKHASFLPGEFPNQKIPVHKLLSDTENNPLSEACPADHLRYFHLPTNNMRWIEKAMARYYNEKVGDHDDFKAPNEMTKAEKLLSREFWRGQLHGGGSAKGPVHARHMRSRCSIVPLDISSGAYTQRDTPSQIEIHATTGEKSDSKNFAIFLPYLHWETDSRRARMAEVIKEVTAEIEEDLNPSSSEREQLTKPKSGLFDVWRAEIKNKRKLKRLDGYFEKPKKSKLGQYLTTLAQVADAMDYEADERLLRDNLHVDPPLHIRRTLDQSYFLTLDDTAARDKDQVVYRATKQGKSIYCRNTRVVMVDQLWLWILDGNTIITSFPRRWGRNKPDPSGVHKSLRDRLSNLPEGQIQSVYDLALIIIDQCSRVFFDRTKPLDQRPEVMDLFASAIGNVTEHTTIAYECFWRNMELRALDPGRFNTRENTNHKYLDINPEGTLLREAQDIAEELRIMLRIYNQQLHVVRDFRKTLGHMNGEFKNEKDEARTLVKLLVAWQNQKENPDEQGAFMKKDVIPESTIQEANDLLELIRNRQAEIYDLEEAALRTSKQLEGLLQLKQQQASIIEAKAALKRADESVKQGRAIMAFTLVTIFFLPLGFFAAFFGMNNEQINGSPWMSLNEQIKYMFGLSTAIIFIAVSMAFSPWTRAWILVLIKVPLAFLAEYSGFRAAWKRYIIDHHTLERHGQRRMDWIFRHEKRKLDRKREEEERRKKEVVEVVRAGEGEENDVGQRIGWFNKGDDGLVAGDGDMC